ncbi:hypothetical protein [Actinoplanes derwentensis]|uniref:Major facilitator superfamily (MFS) profile domain-containing protein n=1 Tax=Actinoplanes derwentensis TaxID=113562 RepID=A0A1H2BFY4_9ACTN|nr:hypothetical protein [Actinoplanes derwentensis]GID87788.1 hypothetical protein Ade03nite_67120 [Actinoplanes derwentensis]SDT57163.1 hypothetical protein SAMN04489716_4585 [Actinoplanes derwentensis]
MTPQTSTAVGRYGTPGQIAGSVVALAGLLLLAGLTGLSSVGFALSSTLCASEDTGLICTGTGQDLALWIPTGAAILAAILGMAGTVLGRPFRVPLLAAGYAVTVVGFVTGLLIAMTGPAS